MMIQKNTWINKSACSTSADSHVPLFSPVAVLSSYCLFPSVTLSIILDLLSVSNLLPLEGSTVVFAPCIFLSLSLSVTRCPWLNPRGAVTQVTVLSCGHWWCFLSYGNMPQNMVLCCFASSAQLAGHAVRLVRLDTTKPFEIWHKEVWQMLTQHGRQSWYAYFPHWWRAPIFPAEWDKWRLTSKHWTMPLLDQHLRVLVSG